MGDAPLRHGDGHGAMLAVYLHHELNTPLIHHGIKPGNLLATDDLTVKVAGVDALRHYAARHEGGCLGPDILRYAALILRPGGE